MNMDIANGQFVDNSSVFSQNGFIGEILNNILSEEAVKTALDTDNSGDLNKEEINMFLNSISNSDNNGENISVEDILTAAQSIQNGDFTLSGAREGITIPQTPEVSGEETTSEVTTEKPKKTKSSHHHSKTDNNKDKDSVKEKTLDTMSKSELGQELSKASGSISEKQNKLDSVLSGSDSTLSGLKDNIETSYQTYLEQLKTVNTDLAGQVDTLKNSISAKESEINSKDVAISQQGNSVTDNKTAYDNAVSNRENLESILSELESTDTSQMNESAKSSIASKISQVKEKLEAAKQDEQNKKTAWETVQTDLETLNGEKTELETGENGLSKLKEQMSALESTVNAQYPQIAQYLNEYNQAKQNYDTAIESAKAELKTAKDYETKVKTAYQDAENEDNKVEYSPQLYNKDFADKVAKLGEKYAKKMDTIGNCLVGVARAIRELFGLKHTALSPLPKAYLATEQFRTDPLLSKHFKEVKVSRDDLANLTAGAVVVWNKSEGHNAGHISIALGNGMEASDHIQKQMNRQNADFTVFYPV